MPATSDLIRRAGEARRRGHLDEARRDLEAAVELLRGAEGPNELMRALGALAHVERDLGREDAARRLYEEAVTVGRERGAAPTALAHALRHLGDVHRDAGRTEEADPCLTEAVALYRDDRSSSELDVANALRALALLREMQGRPGPARALWTEARDGYRKLGIAAGAREAEGHLRYLR